MSHRATPLLKHMYTRFREVFGSPSTMLELDSQWILRPDSDHRAPALFLLEHDVDRIIEFVQHRVAAADASWRNDGHPERQLQESP